jgi:hypothetical protein
MASQARHGLLSPKELCTSRKVVSQERVKRRPSWAFESGAEARAFQALARGRARRSCGRAHALPKARGKSLFFGIIRFSGKGAWRVGFLRRFFGVERGGVSVLSVFASVLSVFWGVFSKIPRAAWFRRRENAMAGQGAHRALPGTGDQSNFVFAYELEVHGFGGGDA